MNIKGTFLWRKLRECKILAAHRRTAQICEMLIAHYEASSVRHALGPKKAFDSDRIIWQYWAQGYENVPDVVRKCLDSVDEYASGFTIIRLSDENLEEYLYIPGFVKEKKSIFSRAFFSDLLRLMLLQTYGGIWLDATIMLTGPIPEDIASQNFFVFRRDPDEPDQKYWRDTYAYYFGWAKGFRVNMLSSFMVAKKRCKTASDLCGAMLKWWEECDYLPDYFFLQILYDVYDEEEKCPIVSDTLPHYLQQSMNDPDFSIMPREEIIKKITIHKLTYK